MPDNHILCQVYPNPFNPTTTISFQLPEAGLVKLEIFDVNGCAVGARHAVPLQKWWYPAGTHQITFDGTGLPSGIYIYRLQAGDLTASGKMILLK
ncbi:MAG: T9SS type A sorting domain-containing protein [Deltaproteobacteria bacterium]|nr:T9SS type A sorting domain-containing protein [Deltaproteobacteria bacterium]